jgi:hypothetical protein
LAVASLFAGVAAAFVGTFLFISFVALWDASHRSDGLAGALMMIPIGATFLTLFGFWIALPLTVPAALILGQLSPPLERLLAPGDLCWVQYGSAAGVGFSVMLALGSLVGGGPETVFVGIAGSLAGLAAVRTFRRFCYA